ncbi:MAG: GTPase HflX [Gemmatimonadota bacterium]|nr:GTPase HflX [Gemmatimonadota bacterium]
MGAPRLDEPEATVDEHLGELARLVDTAGAEVVGTLVQRLAAPHPAHYIGRGKAEQLREEAAALDATLVVFDEDLTPAQGTALEKLLGVRVMDRTELILDIFALRARTAESRFQVELAQLEYMRSRLKRMWTHLSRTQGGIGTRGPGETQIETDRRLIDRRIARLRRELDHIARSRGTRRKGREGEFRVALVGYTNAGKSSLLQGLSGSAQFVEDRLFATLDSATRSVDLGDGYEALVTDTVGFIRKLPHGLVASFRATLEEVAEADLRVHVVDGSAPDWDHQMDAVDEVLAEIGAGEQPGLLAFHKIDRLSAAEEEILRRRAVERAGEAVFTSVREPEGLAPLRAALRARARAERPTVEIAVPVTDGRTLAKAYREAEVLDRRQDGGEIVLTARVPPALIGRLRRLPGVRVTGRDAA